MFVSLGNHETTTPGYRVTLSVTIYWIIMDNVSINKQKRVVATLYGTQYIIVFINVMSCSTSIGIKYKHIPHACAIVSAPLLML